LAGQGTQLGTAQQQWTEAAEAGSAQLVAAALAAAPPAPAAASPPMAAPHPAVGDGETG